MRVWKLLALVVASMVALSTNRLAHAESGAIEAIAHEPISVMSVIHVGGTISQNTTWTAENVYVMDSDVKVADGIRLRIQPGVVVKGTTHTRLLVWGVLDAQGTSEHPIVFTSFRDDTYGGDTNGDGNASVAAPDDWGWIEYEDSSSDAANILTHAVIKYGGRSYWCSAGYCESHYAGVVNLGSASPTISHCTIASNSRYAISMDVNSFPTVAGNVMTRNGAGNGIGVYGGTLSSGGDAAQWTSQDAVYILDGDVGIAEGKRLKIQPGVTVKSRTNSRLLVWGVLDAQGTLDRPIAFTSFRDDTYGGDTNGDGNASVAAPDDWGWIEYEDSSSDAANILTHAVIKYGGRSYWCSGGWCTNHYAGAVWIYSRHYNDLSIRPCSGRATA